MGGNIEHPKLTCWPEEKKHIKRRRNTSFGVVFLTLIDVAFFGEKMVILDHHIFYVIMREKNKTWVFFDLFKIFIPSCMSMSLSK